MLQALVAIRQIWDSTPSLQAFLAQQSRQPRGLGFFNYLRRAAKATSLSRLLSPEEVATAVLYMAADESRPLTGAVLQLTHSLALPLKSTSTQPVSHRKGPSCFEREVRVDHPDHSRDGVIAMIETSRELKAPWN